MSTFKVVVTGEDLGVPDTGGFTAGGFGGMSGMWIGVSVAVLATIAVVVGIILRRRATRDYICQEDGFRISNKSKKIGGLFSILLLSVLVVPLMVGGKNSGQVFADEGDTNLEIAVSDVVMYIETKVGETSSQVTGQNVYVKSSTNNGYTLSMYALSKDLLPTAESNSPIAGLSGSGVTALLDNTWGVALSDSDGSVDAKVWHAVPTTEKTALVLKDVSVATAAGDKTEIYYGVKLTDETAADTYATTINYVATAKVNTP